jgi:hypothetical protein
VCALWVRGRLHVYLAGDLEDDSRWIKKVVTGGEESEQVRMDKDRLESQHMVVMKEQGRGRGRSVRRCRRADAGGLDRRSTVAQEVRGRTRAVAPGEDAEPAGGEDQRLDDGVGGQQLEFK